MFDKKQKSCVKHIQLVTDDGLYQGKDFYKVKIVYIHPLWMMANLLVIKFDYLFEQIRGNVNSLPVSETKIDDSFPQG